MERVLIVDNVEKYYGSADNVTRAVAGISFEAEKGEFVGIMGASGSGKTTLLNIISSIDTPTSGRVFIGGNDITSMRPQELAKFRREKLGFIFQDFNLLDTLTAFENIALALTINGAPAKAIGASIREMAKKLMIEDIMEKYPYQLSGGEKQRVASERAIITDPDIILADEPTGALDSKSARMLLSTFEKMNRDMGATILMVTHDAFTASYCDRILFIKDGKLFSEIVKGEDSRKAFFDRIIEVVTLLGGDNSNVF